jgi:hypothetical protein
MRGPPFADCGVVAGSLIIGPDCAIFVYIDGDHRKTVDCYSPRSTSYEQFLYVNTGLSPNACSA